MQNIYIVSPKKLDSIKFMLPAIEMNNTLFLSITFKPTFVVDFPYYKILQ